MSQIPGWNPNPEYGYGWGPYGYPKPTDTRIMPQKREVDRVHGEEGANASVFDDI